jgi:hypothetical protein
VCVEPYVWQNVEFTFGSSSNRGIYTTTSPLSTHLLFSSSQATCADLLTHALYRYHSILKGSPNRELKGFRIQNMDLCASELTRVSIHLINSLHSLELNNVRIKWDQLRNMLDQSKSMKKLVLSGLKIDNITLVRPIFLPELVYLDITELDHNIFLRIGCPKVQCLKLNSSWKMGRDRTNLGSVGEHQLQYLQGLSMTNCHPVLASAILKNSASCLQNIELLNTFISSETPMTSVHSVTLGSFDGHTMKQVIDKTKALFPNVQHLYIHDTFLENMIANREDGKEYTIHNLQNIQVTKPEGSRMQVTHVSIQSSKIPCYMRQCLEHELGQLIAWSELIYNGLGSGIQYLCADPALVEIIYREIYLKKSIILSSDELLQALILSTGYCQSQTGNTRKRLHELWHHMLKHSFDPIGIREYGVNKLLQKSRHILELHTVMTNVGTSSSIISECETLFIKLQQILQYHQYQEPGPQFPALIKQLERCAVILKKDIEHVNVGNLDVLLNKDSWVSEQIVEEYTPKNTVLYLDDDIEFLESDDCNYNMDIQ